MILLLVAGIVLPLQEQYDARNYHQVAELAPAALATATHADSLQLLQLQAFSLVALGRDDEAAATFRQLLTLKPDLVLDPRAVSPKFRAVFDRVRHVTQQPQPAPQVLFRTDTVLVRQRRSLALLLPGLEQMRKQQRTKGYVLFGTSLATLAGLGASHFLYNGARGDYLRASTPGEIASTYRNVNNWHHTRIVLGFTLSGIWLGSLIDAVLNP